MLVKVRVSAGAKKESFDKSGDRYVISVREKALENRANLRVIELLSIHLKVPIKSIRIIRGHHMPSKILSVAI
jgi:uncharacterized protein